MTTTTGTEATICKGSKQQTSPIEGSEDPMTTTNAAGTFLFTDTTSGNTWSYDSEAQLRTVACLYGRQHPKASLQVTIAGATYKVR